MNIIDQYKFLLIRDDLIAEWLGGSITDTSGSTNIYNGTLNGSPNPTLVNGINGEANGAWDFVSANNQYIDWGLITETIDAPKVTVSTWFKKVAGKTLSITNRQTVINRGVEILWFSDESIVVFVKRTLATGGQITFDATALLGTWVNIVLVFKGSLPEADRLEMWVNGVKVGVTTLPTPTLTTEIADPFRTGYTAVVSRYSEGQVGPSRIWERALMPTEVAQLYAEKTV